MPRHSCQCIPGLHTARYSECGRIPAVDALKQLDSSPASKCQTVLPVTATGYVCSDGDFECAQSFDHFVQTVATVRVSDLTRVGLGDGTAISKHRNQLWHYWNQANMHSQTHCPMGTHAHNYENASGPGRAAHARNARNACVHERRDIHTDWHWENMSARPK